jgi:hypothetical protein
VANYTVDIKALISITVEADSPEQARDRADTFVEAISPTENEALGYSETIGFSISPNGVWTVDGKSDVEEREDEGCATCAEAIETRLLPCDECGTLDESFDDDID